MGAIHPSHLRAAASLALAHNPGFLTSLGGIPVRVPSTRLRFIAQRRRCANLLTPLGRPRSCHVARSMSSIIAHGVSQGAASSTRSGVTFLELAGLGVEERMKSIADIQVKPLESPSRFVRPQSIHYVQDGKGRRWDMVASHPSVAILIFHKGLDAILMVRQFRPAAYISACAEVLEREGVELETGGMTAQQISSLGVPLQQAYTYELCAGLVDKDGKSIAQVAKEEVLEETGFDVPLGSLQEIAVALSAVGMSGAKQWLFYTEVDDTQKSTQGGGNDHEGEAIDLVGLPVQEIDRFVSQHEIPKSPGALFALMWFKMNKLGSK